MRVTLSCTAALAALLILGCPGQQGSQQQQAQSSGLPALPVSRSTRNYIQVHESVKKAWGLVEATYAVVLEKWKDSSALMAADDPAERERGVLLREQVNNEIQQNIFQVNAEIESLFQEALAAEPDNPLNYAAYAYYLKPRKRPMPDGAPRDTEGEAVDKIDKAIELWPDESSFYLLKVEIISSAQICHEWVRSTPYEAELIAQRMDTIRELLDKAEQYDPDNSYINYKTALMEAHYGPAQLKEGSDVETVPFDDLRGRIVREIRSGNKKRDNRFFFPPPLLPYNQNARNATLLDDSLEPAYVDQWNQFGHWDTIVVDDLLTKLTSDWTWNRNKDDVAQLLLMLFKLGETEPYDRSFFGLVLKLLQPFQEKTEPGSPERLALAQAMRNLDSHYMELTSEIKSRRMLKDPSLVGVMAVHEAELNFTRNPFLMEYDQGHFSAWLRKANETLELGLELGDDPEKW